MGAGGPWPAALLVPLLGGTQAARRPRPAAQVGYHARAHCLAPNPPANRRPPGHLRALANPRRHHTILRWANELGPIFVLRVLWMRIVVLTNPAAVSALFSRSVLSERPPAISQMDRVSSDVHAETALWPHPARWPLQAAAPSQPPPVCSAGSGCHVCCPLVHVHAER